MEEKAIQDYYPDRLNHCYGCGSLNEHGLHFKSYWRGEMAVGSFVPEAFHVGPPGHVYGGLLASLIDCHGNATACAVAYLADGRALGSEPLLRYVTAALHVEYLRPTPIEGPLELEGRVSEINGRETVVEVTVSVAGQQLVRGMVVSVLVPARFLAEEP